MLGNSPIYFTAESVQVVGPVHLGGSEGEGCSAGNAEARLYHPRYVFGPHLVMRDPTGLVQSARLYSADGNVNPGLTKGCK